jgi:hypothetical protein
VVIEVQVQDRVKLIATMEELRARPEVREVHLEPPIEVG